MADIKATRNGSQVITGEVRLSYVHLLEPQEDDYGNSKYQARILIPNDDTETLDALREAKKVVIKEQMAKKWGGQMPKVFADSLKDCNKDTTLDGEIYADKDENERDKFAVNASSRNPIEVVNASMRPATDSEVYSGVYARVVIQPFLYMNKGKRGIGYGLQAVQIIRDGEPLSGGKVSAKSVFSAVASDSFVNSAHETDSDVSDDDLDALLG